MTKKTSRPTNDGKRRGYLSRREFVGSAIAVAPALTLKRFAAQSTTSPSLGPAFTEPREIRSVDGVLEATLRVRGDLHQVPVPENPTQTTELRLRTYDGEIPGPTLRARVGDRIRVTLENHIDPSQFPPTSDTACNVRRNPNPPPGNWYPGRDRFPACFHGDNTTNLHYHGSHVSPEGSGDNVLVEVRPGETFENDFVLTKNDSLPPRFAAEQPPGTHWYHPHKHGSVALQVINGMAGAFIVEGDVDDELNRFYTDSGHELEEKLLVIQQFGDKINLDFSPDRASAPPVTVNGAFQPVIRMRPNEVQRWRLVNATMQQLAHKRYRFLNKSVYDAAFRSAAARATGRPFQLPFANEAGDVPEIRQIARDGVQFAGETYERLRGEQEFELAPGNRIDILVKAPPRPGQAVLDLVNATELPAEAPIRASEQYLVAVEISGDPVDMPLPDANVFQRVFPAYLEDIDESEIRIRRRVEFKMEGKVGGAGGESSPPRFTIDGREFDPGRVDQVMLMGAAEEWTIVNTSPPGAIHPFHIHINPFQVVEVYDPELMGETPQVMKPPYVWQDTIVLPPSFDATTVHGLKVRRYGHVKIRHRFVDFPGKFVLHCHILGHEDRGMMQLVEVIDPNV